MELKVYFWGYGGHSHYAERLRPLVTELGMDLVCMHEHDNADVKWTLDTWKDELRKADICILPTDPIRFPAKSSNKLTQALSMGKPCIASPLDAYKAVEEKYPGCCLFAENDEQWRKHLTLLRDNLDVREALSKKGPIAAQDHHIDRVCNQWINIFNNFVTKVDIVIPTYNNARGLPLCLDSIRQCTPEPHTIIVVNNGDNSEVHNYLDQQGDIRYIKHDRMTFAQAVNIGIRAGDGKHVLILNDDVIVSRGWLSKMLGACKSEIGAVGVLSNCDQGWLHNYSLNIAGVDLLPGRNTFEEIEPIIPEIYNFQSPYNEVVQREWLAFYCTLIPRSVVDKVGVLCEEYVNSGEDVDYCNRIRKYGYKLIQNYNSFVFHFGAVSRKGLEKEDHEKYQEEDKRTQAVLSRIWGKKTVVLYSGPSWQRWDFRNVDQGGIGGSETWQVMLSREFEKLGYRVISFCDCPEPRIKDGEIEYYHFTDYNRWIDEHWIDYFISSRTTDTLRFPVRAERIYVMIHDIFLLSERYQLFPEKVYKYCVLSDWHKKFVMDYHGISEDQLILTSNGIDLSKFEIEGIERNPYRLHWSSSPDRGLDTLLYLFDFIKMEIPELELHIFYGFDNWEKSARSRNSQADLNKIEELKKAMDKPGVVYHGKVGQKELVIEELKSSLWAYSSDFEETFCCHPDSKILIYNDLQTISSVKEGDLVYTHKGQYKKVLNIMSREFSGPIYEYSLKYLKDPLRVTGEHPLYVVRRNDIKCLRLSHCVCNHSSDRCKPGYCYYNKNGKKYHTKSSCANIDKILEPIWIPAKEVNEKDFIAYPINRCSDSPKMFSSYVKTDKLVSGKVVSSGLSSIAHSISDFIINEDFMELCGWFVSKGCFDLRSQVFFCLNKKEEEEAQFIEKQLLKVGLTSKRYYEIGSESMTIKTSSVVLGRFFVDNFGHKSRNLFIPQWVKDLKTPLLNRFLKGIIKGDGYVDRDCMAIELSSEKLILDLFDVLLKINCISSLRNTVKPGCIRIDGKIKRDKNKKLNEYRLCCSMSQNINFFRSIGLDIDPSVNGHTPGFINGDYAFLPIKKIIKKYYDGMVHNLEVEEDNSYIANGVTVHNCITAIECQYAGVPVIASNYAGLQTTIGNSGILIGNGEKGQSYTKEYREEFVMKCVEILKNREKWQEWSEKGKENAKRFTWANVALNWQREFES